MSEPTDGVPGTPADESPEIGATGEAHEAFVGPEWIGKYSLQDAGGGGRRISAKRRAKRRMQRRTGWILIGVGGLMVLTAAWLVITGLMARSELTAMKTDLVQLRNDVSSGNIDDARILSVDVAHRAHHAHSLTTGPAWWTVSQVPGIGDPFQTARGLSAAADSLGTTTVPKLVSVAAAVDPSQFKLQDHTIQIDSLIKVTPQLDSATADVNRVHAQISTLPHHTWLGPINNVTNDVNSTLGNLIGSMDTIDQAAQVAPTLLGYSTPQRYFLAFQNEAEARGTGGLPGAFAIILVDHGKLSFTHFGNDGELDGVDSGLDFGPDYDATWKGFNPTKTYLNSDVDPDFRYAGQIWAAMWEKKSGEHVNGALSLDPTALSYLLSVTGPATMPDGTEVSASNVVALTQSTVYAQFSDQTKRKAYLLQVAQVADQKILGGSADAKSLFKAAAKAAGQRRILLWDEDKPTESLLAANTIGGTVPDTSGPFIAPVVINYGANKLDYYLHTSVKWASAGCGSTRGVTVTITLTNTAPASGLSTYVTQRTDKPPYETAAGDNKVMLYYVGTAGGSLSQITVDGSVVTAQPGRAGIHASYSALVELPRGKTQTVVLQLREPSTTPDVVVRTQPTINAAQLVAREQTC